MDELDRLFESLIETKNPQIKFKPEIEEGNIEYKLRLDYKTDYSLKKMKNQMNWRFEEGKELTGKRECYYVLGIEDDGNMGCLTENEINLTFDIFKKIVTDCDAQIIQYMKKELLVDRWMIFIHINKLSQKKLKEINIGFIGGSQTGKTTTIGNIVYGELDNGCGTSRLNVFKHEHERLSGYTSSIKKEIVGVKNNKIINYNTGVNTSWDQIAGISDKIINLIDLPGSSQYIKTILFGLSTFNFDGLVIFHDDDDEGLNNLYIKYACLLDIPFIIVQIKDSTTPTSLSSCNFNFNMEYNDKIICPEKIKKEDFDIHHITNIEQYGINKIIKFMLSIDKKNNVRDIKDSDVFMISDIVSIPDTGIIYSGEVWNGKISRNDKVFLTNGNLTFNLVINSIHKKQIADNYISKGESGSILLSSSNMDIQKESKHMIITKNQQQLYNHIIIKSYINININNELTIYINNNKLKGFIKEINDEKIPLIYKIIFKQKCIIIPRKINFGFVKIKNTIILVELII